VLLRDKALRQREFLNSFYEYADKREWALTFFCTTELAGGSVAAITPRQQSPHIPAVPASPKSLSASKNHREAGSGARARPIMLALLLPVLFLFPSLGHPKF
jgi:hypothetical protein